jgi:hypothetical protein
MLLAIASALLLQDPAEWIERLGDDDVLRREEAVRHFKSMGEDARPHLEKALKAGGDAAAQAKAILEYLERTRRARAILAIGSPFSVEAPREKPAKLADVLAQLARHFGLELDAAPELADVMWSGRIEKAKLLPALDHLAGDAGLCCSVAGTRLVVSRGKFVARPADYPGAFRVTALSAALERHNDFEKPSRRATVALAAAHQSGLVDVPAASIRAESVEFDTGEVVKVEPPKERESFADPDVLTVALKDPPDGAKSIRRVRGTLVVKVPVAWETWTLEKPEAGAKAKTAAGEAAIEGFDRGTYEEADTVTLFVVVRGDAMGPELLQRVGASAAVELVSKEGKEAPTSSEWPARHRWSGHWKTIEVEARFVIPKGSGFQPAKAVVRIPKELETVELPFDLRW